MVPPLASMGLSMLTLHFFELSFHDLLLKDSSVIEQKLKLSHHGLYGGGVVVLRFEVVEGAVQFDAEVGVDGDKFLVGPSVSAELVFNSVIQLLDLFFCCRFYFFHPFLNFGNIW